MKKLFKKIERAVYENKLLYLPRFMDMQNQIDLNTVSSILNTLEIINTFKFVNHFNNHDAFSQSIQLQGVEKHRAIAPIHNIIVKNLGVFNIDRADIFFSLKKTSGPTHTDHENSLILSVYNKTLYSFPDDGTLILMSPGDLLLVPAGRIHFASSFESRIILSWGLYKK
tara:strand:- start:321 stop:827 length:507 start_codon:yes stop_codon:yes gene_type:complete